MRTIFITGTDTGVGKTLLTALLITHLRQSKVRALALKPFCSGGRDDAELLHSLQQGELTLDEINPFFYPEPVAPLVSARRHRRHTSLDQVIQHIENMAQRCDCLLVEGAGGLLVPLGEDYTVLDVITHLRCETIVVSSNKLGTINHTLLTVRALQTELLSRASLSTDALWNINTSSRQASRKQVNKSASAPVKVVLMNAKQTDESCASNARMLAEFLAPTTLNLLPFLAGNCSSPGAVEKNAKKLKKPLARLLG